MKKHCRVCNKHREFNLIAEDELADIYECESCALKSKRRTLLGWGITGAGATLALVGAVFGIESLHDHNS